MASFDETTVVITDYINFCVDSNIPRRTVKVYPNNKPWVSKQLSELLKLKNNALCTVNRADVVRVQKRIKKQVRTFKAMYKDKIERNFRGNNARSAWKALQHLADYKQSQLYLNLLSPNPL